MLLILLCWAATVIAGLQHLQGIPKINQTIVKELLNQSEIETIVIFDYGHEEALMDHIPHGWLHRPYVVITAHLEWQLKDYFGKRILSLVYVKSNCNVNLLENLKKALDRWHLEYIVFVSTESEEYLINWQPLFQWCHENGFFNSILMDFQGFMYDYNNFEGHGIVKTSAERFFVSRSLSNNLHGFPIQASIANIPPRALVWHDRDSTPHLAGYYPQAIKLFSKLYNASAEFSLISSQLHSKAEEECWSLINRGVADLCADEILLSTTYIKTYPEQISYGYLMVPCNKPLEYYYYFIKPFHSNVWLVVQVSAIFKILTLSFIHRMQRKSWNFGHQIQYSILSVLHLPFRLHRVQGAYQRFLESIMILVGFAVANWYLAVLYSILSSPLYKDHINSLDDLVKHNIPIMVNRKEEIMLKNSNLTPQVRQQLWVVDTETVDEHRRSLNSSFAYFSQQDNNQFYLHQQKYKIHPRMKELQQYPINHIYPGIAMRPYWPLEDKFRMFLLRLMENGLYQHLMSSAYTEGITSNHLKYLPTNFYTVKPLGVEYFQMSAMLLAGGILAAALSFVFEILIHRIMKKTKKQARWKRMIGF